MSDRNFLCFLTTRNIIDEDQKRLIEIESGKKQITIDQAIIKMNFMSNSTLSKFIKEYRNEDRNLSDFIIDIQIVRQVPYKFCINHSCLPVSMNDDCLVIAMTQHDINVIEKINTYLDFKKTRVLIGSKEEIYELIQKNYANVENWIDFIEFSDRTSEVFIDRLLLDAVSKKASDIHFSPEESIIRVRYRVDGNLKRVCIFHKDYYSQVCIRLKILFSVDITTSIQPRDGSMSKFVFGNKVDFRIAFHNILHGENVVIRILTNINHISLEKVGYSRHILQDIKKMIHSPGGLVIFIGPTGSGKTTSLYSALKEIDANIYNIMTVEDPVECNLPGIQQADVNQHPDMNFSSCLRSIMRQDPDVLLIGEIRDAETANIALRASMTGHKVFTTLHARDIFSVFDRLEEFGLSRRLLTNNVKGIVAQRLIHKICSTCNRSGCHSCEYTGYQGRSVVAESIYFSDEIISVFLSSSNNEEKKGHLLKRGHLTLKDDIRLKIVEGTLCKEKTHYMDWIEDV